MDIYLKSKCQHLEVIRLEGIWDSYTGGARPGHCSSWRGSVSRRRTGGSQETRWTYEKNGKLDSHLHPVICRIVTTDMPTFSETFLCMPFRNGSAPLRSHRLLQTLWAPVQLFSVPMSPLDAYQSEPSGGDSQRCIEGWVMHFTYRYCS